MGSTIKYTYIYSSIYFYVAKHEASRSSSSVARKRQSLAYPSKNINPLASSRPLVSIPKLWKELSGFFRFGSGEEELQHNGTSRNEKKYRKFSLEINQT